MDLAFTTQGLLEPENHTTLDPKRALNQATIALALDAFAARAQRKLRGRILEALTPGAGFEPLDDDEIIEMIAALRAGTARAVAAERDVCAAIAGGKAMTLNMVAKSESDSELQAAIEGRMFVALDIERAIRERGSNEGK